MACTVLVLYLYYTSMRETQYETIPINSALPPPLMEQAHSLL